MRRQGSGRYRESVRSLNGFPECRSRASSSARSRRSSGVVGRACVACREPQRGHSPFGENLWTDNRLPHRLQTCCIVRFPFPTTASRSTERRPQYACCFCNLRAGGYGRRLVPSHRPLCRRSAAGKTSVWPSTMLPDGAMPRSLASETVCRTEGRVDERSSICGGTSPRTAIAEVMGARRVSIWVGLAELAPVDRCTSPAEAEPGNQVAVRVAVVRFADDKSVKDDVDPWLRRLGYVDGTSGSGCSRASLQHTTVVSEQCPRLHKSAAECHFCRFGAVSAHRRVSLRPCGRANPGGTAAGIQHASYEPHESTVGESRRRGGRQRCAWLPLRDRRLVGTRIPTRAGGGCRLPPRRPTQPFRVAARLPLLDVPNCPSSRGRGIRSSI